MDFSIFDQVPAFSSLVGGLRFTVTDGVCKEYIFHYRKWLRKLYLQHEQHPHER